jgi:hypothetical protein
MNSPLERREIRLRGLLPRVPGATKATRILTVDSSVARWDRWFGWFTRRSFGMTIRGVQAVEAPRRLRGFPLFQRRLQPLTQPGNRHDPEGEQNAVGLT